MSALQSGCQKLLVWHEQTFAALAAVTSSAKRVIWSASSGSTSSRSASAVSRRSFAATNSDVAVCNAASLVSSSPHLPVPFTAALTALMWITKLSFDPCPVHERRQVFVPVRSL
eukprot:scaffold10329_cov66-Cyclotella_meneghiniana.AAC.2